MMDAIFIAMGHLKNIVLAVWLVLLLGTPVVMLAIGAISFVFGAITRLPDEEDEPDDDEDAEG